MISEFYCHVCNVHFPNSREAQFHIKNSKNHEINIGANKVTFTEKSNPEIKRIPTKKIVLEFDGVKITIES